jgi:hypothetical protein
MIKQLGFIGAAVCALSLMSGCVIRRDITDIIAHKDYNNYKIQTMSMHWALFWAWPTSEVWTCQKAGEGFKCHMVDYDASLKGYDNGGSKAAPAAAAAEAPAEGAAAPAEGGK